MLGGFLNRSHKVFKCPADLSQAIEGVVAYPPVRSVSMNGWIGGYFPWDSVGVVAQRTSDFVNPPPADVFLFVDERPDSINDSYFAVSLASNVVVDGPGNFHNKAAAESFADGHADAHRWLTPAFQNAPSPGGSFAGFDAPGNADRKWLQTHSGQVSRGFRPSP
jgi:hypothetical protein